MANFGELVLVIGDLHMPQRAADIPAKVRRALRCGLAVEDPCSKGTLTLALR